MERLNPSLAIERNKYEQQLADQGIRYGSPAYENMMRNYSMQANDARLGVIGQGGAEQQRLSEMARLAGEFGNKAQQQIYEQAKGAASSATRRSSKPTSNCSGAASSAMRRSSSSSRRRRSAAPLPMRRWRRTSSRRQTAFNATNAARQQYLNEQFALRNQPINEITALLSGSQVQQPNFLQPNSRPSQPPTWLD